MEYTTVDKMRISKLTLGTAQLGDKYGIANTTGKPDSQQAIEILKIAVANGINCFDAAPGYGDSESIIGSFVGSRNIKGPLIVVSKMPPADLGEKATTKAVHAWVEKTVFKSLENLKIEQIPVYLLHRAGDMKIYGGSILESLFQLKREGFIGLIGVSVYSPEEVEYALSIEAFGAIQAPINIFDHRLIQTGLLTRLKNKNFTVFARSIFLQGLFFLDSNHLPTGLRLAKEPLEKLKKLTEEWKINIDELALGFVNGLPGITSIVIGAETPGQLNKDIALINATRIHQDLRDEVLRIFADMPIELINPSLWHLA